MAAKQRARIAPSTDTAGRNAATVADRMVLEIRKFIASAIFFNAKAAESVGLGLTDMQMVHTLQLYGPSTPGKLAQSTGLSSGGVTVALDRLERAGYVKREANPADRRSLLVALVPSRIRKLEALYKDVERNVRQQLEMLSEKDIEAALRVFAALAEARTSPE
jgi:DNA-binding MarR family transcriptional regulator